MSQRAPISVLHVASADLWAGAEVQVYHLLCALDRRQDVRVGALLLNDGELARRLRSAGIPVEVCDERKSSPTAICMAIAANIRRNGCELVHTHRLKENLLGSLATLGSGRTRSLRTVHGKPEHRAATSIRRVALRVMDGVATRLQQRIVGVSDELCEELRSLYTPEKVVCIPNGIDAREVAERAHLETGFAPSAAHHVAFVGRFVPVKRVDIFLHAAAEVCKRDANQVRFVAVGDGPLHAESVALAERLGISDRVEFLGFQSNPLPIIRQMSCVVLTSDHEGLPMVVLEALALGVPVVATNVGGLPEVLRDVPRCRLVSSRDPAAFARAIQESLEETSSGSAGRSPPVRSLLPPRYDIEASAAAYAALYQELRG